MSETKTAVEVPDNYAYAYKSDYERDWDTHQKYITNFNAYEAMGIGQVYDSVSKSVDGSKITDSYAATLAMERADRVMAKLPDGVTESVGRTDRGKAAFLDIIRQKWYYPNANAQHPFLEKLTMVDYYSQMYGFMGVFVDVNASPTGYVGPDFWLWNPRNIIPQQGRNSVPEMDYLTAVTWVSTTQLKGWLDAAKAEGAEGGWDPAALEWLIEKSGQRKGDSDAQRDTEVQTNRTPGATHTGIMLATRYEAGFYDEKTNPNVGRWITFAPDDGCVEIRKLPNPHRTGRIPFIIKYGRPLFDSFYGLGDFQRSKPLQFARDGLTNFYFTGVKNQLVPPLVANANGVIKHTLDYRSGGVILETLPNSVRTLDTGSGGLPTYQATMQALTGQMLSQFGSQNASLPAADSLNPSQGRTPAAIDLYNDKEATRDGAEVRRMESFIEQLIDYFNALTVNVCTEEIPITLFYEDLAEIQKSGIADVSDLFNESLEVDAAGNSGKLTIKPDVLKGVEYRFNIAGGTTQKENKEKSLAGVERLLGVIGKFQNVIKDDPRIEINFPAIMKSYEQFSDIKGAGEFIKIKPGPSPQELQLQQENQQLQQMVQQLQMQLQQTQQQGQEQQRVASEDAKYAKADSNLQLKEQQIAAQQQAAAAAAASQPTPTVAGNGTMFKDPQLAQVANAVNKF